jgi:hypothetical protein
MGHNLYRYATCAGLKVENPKKYGFDPKQLVLAIVEFTVRLDGTTLAAAAAAAAAAEGSHNGGGDAVISFAVGLYPVVHP